MVNIRTESPIDTNFSVQFGDISSQKKYIYVYIYTEGYNDSTEPIGAVKYFASGEIRTHNHDRLPSTTPGIDATNCATKKDPQKRMLRKR